MHTHHLDRYSHDHVFNQDARRAGEKRTLNVVINTAVMTVDEIATGLTYGLMALLAGGPSHFSSPAGGADNVNRNDSSWRKSRSRSFSGFASL